MVALSPARTENNDSLRLRTAHRQFEYGSTAWNIRWSSVTPQMLTPRSLISVQSTARTTAARASCEKKTSVSCPVSNVTDSSTGKS